MTVLVRYVVGEQLRMLLLTVSGLAGMDLAVVFMDRMRTFLAHDAGVMDMVQYFAFSLPMVLAEVTPFALLLSTVLVLGGLSSRSEIVAMRAAGIGMRRLALPLLGVGLSASLIWAWLGLSFIPGVNEVSGRILEQSAATPEEAVFVHDRIWFRTENNTFFGIRSADMAAGTMSGIRVLELDGNGGVARLTTAQRMEWKEGAWQLLDGRVAENGEAGLQLHAFTQARAPLTRTPEALKQVAVRPEELSHRRLAEYVRRLGEDGYDPTRYKVDLAERLAYPFASLIMVLVAIPYGLLPLRSHGLARGLGISLVIALAFWLLYSLSTALGRTGILPAAASAWLPMAVFSAWGVYRLLAVRQ